MLTENYIHRLKELAGIKDLSEEAGVAKTLTPDRDYFFNSLSLINDVKTKADIARYNAIIERINSLYLHGKLNMDITDDIDDTNFFMDQDIDKRYFEEIEEEKMDELDNLTDEDLASGQESSIDFLDSSEIPLNMTIEDLIIQAKGLTEYIGAAGYVLRDGGLLDFFGGNPDRADHRTLEIPVKEDFKSGTDLMHAFMDITGAIRIDGDKGSIHMRGNPSMAQWKILEKIILKNRDDFYIDMGRDGGEMEYLKSPMALDMIQYKIEEFYN